jgi:leucyl aminopeptidase
VLVSCIALAVASTLPSVPEQLPLSAYQHAYPGFDLDLNARRLVQMEGKAPVWMTELEKVDRNALGSLFIK